MPKENLAKRYLLDSKGEPVEIDAVPDGMRLETKIRHWGEVFSFFHPKDLSSEKPPLNVLNDFFEVFGDEARSGKLFLAWHPWFRRWGLWSNVFFEELGCSVPMCRSVYQAEAIPGQLPADLDEADGRFENLRGVAGEFRMPTKKDFELFRRVGDWRLPVKQIAANLREEQIQQQKAAKLRKDAKLRDLQDYGWNAIRRAALRDVGGGTNPFSVDKTAKVRSNPVEYDLEEKDGYVVRRKKLSEAHEAERKEMLDRYFGFKNLDREWRGKKASELSLHELRQFGLEWEAKVKADEEKRQEELRAAGFKKTSRSLNGETKTFWVKAFDENQEHDKDSVAAAVVSVPKEERRIPVPAAVERMYGAG